MIDEPAVALAVLEPVRAEDAGGAFEPGSSTTVAHALGQPRQKINYHLHALERWTSCGWRSSASGAG